MSKLGRTTETSEKSMFGVNFPGSGVWRNIKESFAVERLVIPGSSSISGVSSSKCHGESFSKFKFNGVLIESDTARLEPEFPNIWYSVLPDSSNLCYITL
jgi:hypothetical protein